jgi:hypothetical protein
LNVDQGINRNSRVSGKLDKGVEGEGQAVVQLICEILQQTRVINGDIECKVAGVDEIRVLSNRCKNLVAGFRDGRTALCFRTPTSPLGLA